MVNMCPRKTSIAWVDCHIIQQFENRRQYWRKVLERAVSVIKFLGEEIIGSPSNSNYLGVMEVLAKYDSFLAQHIVMFVNKGRGNPSYLSSTIWEELISLMGSMVLDKIINELKSAMFYSVSVDSTPILHTQIN